MYLRSRKASKYRGSARRDSTVFGKVRENTIATYSKKRPVSIAKTYDFLTPDAPEDCVPSSDKTNSKSDTNKKDSIPKNSPSVDLRRGSSLALRNISNIPLEKTLGRTPCAPNQQLRRANRRLTPNGFSPAKVNSSDNKECKIYQKELQRNNNSKKITKKSKAPISTTTYSLKSMSCCSVCGGPACTNGHNSLSTIKSMSLCHSLPGGDILDDLSLGDEVGSDDSQVLQPHNSTLAEEDCQVELKDIIPQDLSAILEEPADEEQCEPLKKSKIDTEIHSGEVDVSPITAGEKLCIAPVENKSTHLKKTVCQQSNANEADEPDVTPEAFSNKESTCATVEPRQKRKLAYSVEVNKGPDCVLLNQIPSIKKPAKVTCKPKNNSQWASLPEDCLCHQVHNIS